ncbi:hypothetical protein [Actinoplanes sp. NBRC 103695]|uniref:hypothetical protein n=1 Tax=Actinoplanes sp. NBRC 103695 TaxID=3032202 RepID=UPI0024A10408|nr:hypothetical protein [Actinoplanes sp. NBRC 103695]GLY92904.1 hypothetical protein Acsp02_01600 [Actinoplanes sp. NBRC 103695]
MITRWLPLYLRSRRVPLTATISLAAVALVAVLWSAGADRPEVDPSLAALTVVLGLAPLITTLAGDDDALEKTAALPWPPRRVLHLIGAGAFVAVMLLSARAAGADFGPAWQIIRNSAGLAGLIGLGVALVGTRLAWTVPIVWTALQAMLAAPGGPGWRQCLFWLIQPVSSVPAAVTAAALLVAGLLTYAVRVSPPTPPTEAESGG